MAQYSPGQRLSYDGALCTVRYVGEVAGTSGAWLGVEWDDLARGKHDGTHKGVRYFGCKSKSPTAASFVRPTRPADPPRTFVTAVYDKYASEVAAVEAPAAGSGGKPPAVVPVAPHREIIISGKVAEEVGFDKIRRKLARVEELKIVILDGMRVASAGEPVGTGRKEDRGREKSIRETCPRITELDLSRNLFTTFGTVVDICRQLEDLRSLRVNGNRFRDILEDEKLRDAGTVFAKVGELAVEETLMTWDEICYVASRFPTLATLHASTNQLSCLSPISPPSSPMVSTLTSLSLEYNDFTSLSDLASLASLKSLRNLHLKGNNIASVTSSNDISYNRVATWDFVDALPAVFPGLTSLRFAHNPIYDNPTLDSFDATAVSAATPAASGGNATGTATTTVTEEAYMITVARLAKLRALNFSAVTATDRTNAEMFYLSRIARQMAAVPAGEAEAAVAARHPRFAELCELYGEPAVVRRTEVNPAFLEARLVSVLFHIGSSDGGKATEDKKTKVKEAKPAKIPKGFDMYAVKGIAGRLFGLSPLRIRLVWETGEWDPVAGFDEEDEGGGGGDHSSDEEEMEAEQEKKQQQTEDQGGEGYGYQVERKRGRWVKREVELKDSPRQFGFCVDGLEARIRVEVR